MLLFYPEPLKVGSRVYRICKENNIGFHNDPTKSYDLHIFWSMTPNKIIPDQFTLTDKKVINRGCWDISKVKVHKIFNDYTVDPITYVGKCVQKWDRQGRHDGHSIITCPTKRLPGYVYEKYIKDKIGENYIKYRVYYGDGINFVLKQEKKTIFGSDYTKHTFINKRMLLTEKQEMVFLNKCKLFGVDYADIEFMMDNNIPTVIDVNNVAGPPFYTKEIKKAMDNVFLDLIKRWK